MWLVVLVREIDVTKILKPHGLITNVTGGIIFNANPVDGGLFRWHVVMELLKANGAE